MTFAQQPVNNSIVWGFDSIAAFGDATQSTESNSFSWGWTGQATLLSKGEIKQLWNAGVPGNTCAQALARFQTDVVAHHPAKLAIGCGTNDLPWSPFTKAQLAAESTTYQSLLTASLSAGIQPICIGIPPRSDFPAAIGNAQTFNSLIKGICAANNAPFIDFWTLLANPATGTYKTGYDLGDHVHPSHAAAVVMGQYFVNQFAPAPPCAAIFAQNQATWQPVAAGNLIENGLFLTTPEWIAGYGTAPSPSVSVVAPSICDVGNWMQIVFPPATVTGAGQFYSFNYTNIAAVPGHTYSLSYRLRVSGLTANGGAINLTYGYFGPTIAYQLTNNIADGMINFEAVCPSGVTQFNPAIVVYSTTGPQSITVSIAQAGLYDVTPSP
jgi:lysophospholipase L1-like esterase